MDKKYVVSISGKEHVTYDGLLDEAHQRGLTGIAVEVVQQPREENAWTTICTAMASFSNGTHFSEIGDANPKNCNSKIAVHSIRMAATRAKARALRDALNIKGAALEELGGEDFHPAAPAKPAPAKPATSAAPGLVTEAQLKRLYAIVRETGIKTDLMKDAIKQRWGLDSSKDLTKAQYDELVDDMLPVLAAGV